MNRTLWKQASKTPSIVLTIITALVSMAVSITAIASISTVESRFVHFVDQDSAMAAGVNKLYALGLQRGQAMRNLLINSTDKQAMENFDAAVKDFDLIYGGLSTRFASTDLNRQYQQIGELNTQNIAAQRQIISTSDQEAAMKAVAEIETPIWRSMKALILELENELTAKQEVAQSAMRSYVGKVKLTQIGLLILCWVLLALNLLSIVRTLLIPIQLIADGLRKIDQNDLTAKVEVRRGITGYVAESINRMVTNLCGIISARQQDTVELRELAQQLAGSSQIIDTASQEISQAIEEVATGATGQAESSATIEMELNRFSEQLDAINKILYHLEERSDQTHVKARHGQEAMGDAERSLIGLKSAFANMRSGVSNFAHSLTQVNSIVDTMNTIAGQTNLLALNATIEAARAGDVGRGFAVVANEVRSLAEQSSQSSAHISTLISQITTEFDDLESVLTQSVASVENQTAAVTKTVAALDMIIGDVGQTTNAVQEAFTRFDQAITSKSRILDGMENISAMSQRVSAATEEIAATAVDQHGLVSRVSRSAGMLQQIADQAHLALSAFKTQ